MCSIKVVICSCYLVGTWLLRPSRTFTCVWHNISSVWVTTECPIRQSRDPLSNMIIIYWSANITSIIQTKKQKPSRTPWMVSRFKLECKLANKFVRLTCFGICSSNRYRYPTDRSCWPISPFVREWASTRLPRPKDLWRRLLPSSELGLHQRRRSLDRGDRWNGALKGQDLGFRHIRLEKTKALMMQHVFFDDINSCNSAESGNFDNYILSNS